MDFKRWMMGTSCALVLFSCGSNANTSDDSKKRVTADMFAEEYLGSDFYETFDANGSVVDRGEEEDVMWSTRVGPDGRVFLASGWYDIAWEYDECSIWIEPGKKVIPEQSCAYTYLDDDDEPVTVTTTYTGRWGLTDGTLSLDVESAIAVQNADAFAKTFDGLTSTYTFTGEQTAEPVASTPDRDDDTVVVIDGDDDDDDPDQPDPDIGNAAEGPAPDEPEADPQWGDREGPACGTRADCRVDQECTSVGCLSHQYCTYADWDVNYADDGYEYVGEWSDCSDGKVYEARCLEYGVVDFGCTCTVNDIETAEFSWPADEFESPSRTEFHRVFNRECGWLNPELDY